ncbi:MAG: DUF1349 domain-containing protein [Chloroflexi bacterium]|nr:DUF1349 domain-containing protein [Chloroflexota bacterium]
MMNLDAFSWINAPRQFEIQDGILRMKTDPETDFWQRTYYGFQNDNAHAFVTPVQESTFTFTVKTDFTPRALYDQCGVVIYQDSENWFKASLEYDNEHYARLGSVVTNLGYSDWASRDVDPEKTVVHYRLSRRGQDFLIESSEDGENFNQMRMFHMHQPIDAAHIGVYACSPLQSSVEVEFSDFRLGPCGWEAHAG